MITVCVPYATYRVAYATQTVIKGGSAQECATVNVLTALNAKPAGEVSTQRRPLTVGVR